MFLFMNEVSIVLYFTYFEDEDFDKLLSGVGVLCVVGFHLVLEVIHHFQVDNWV